MFQIGSNPRYYAHYGRGHHNILTGRIQCSGQESSLLECSRNDRSITNCGSNEVAGVQCEGMVITHFNEV